MKKTVLIFLCMVALITLIYSSPVKPPAGANSYGEAQIGGAFTLTDTKAERVSSQSFAGRYMLVYLGYSHCPDICPATLSMLSNALKKLGADADKVAVVFISLDPAHDSPQVLGDYLKSFDPRIIGLTGSEADIRAVTKAFKAYATPDTQTTPGNMLISHSGLLYLLDKQGKYIQHFETGATDDAVITALHRQF